MWWFNITRKKRPGFLFLTCVISPCGVAAFWMKLFQSGKKSEADEKLELPLNQCKTTNMTGTARPWDKRRRGVRTCRNVELGSEITGASWKRAGNEKHTTLKGADPTCVFSFPVTGWRGTWKIGDDRGQQGGGRVPPIGQINTLHFFTHSWQHNKSQAGTGRQLPIITSATDTGRPHDLSTVHHLNADQVQC